MSPSASSGVGIAHLPNQRHKIVSKRGANFTLMVCGEFILSKKKKKKKNIKKQKIFNIGIKVNLA